MGFKHVSLKELETKLSPAFIGHPIKHIEELSEFEKTYEEKKSASIEVISDVLINGEETIEYEFDKNKELKTFSGSGILSIINDSKKDRIWDVRVNLHQIDNTNIGEESLVKLGNFEPQTNKKINYMIKDRENLIEPLKLTEKIDVLDMNLKNISKIEAEEEPEEKIEETKDRNDEEEKSEKDTEKKETPEEEKEKENNLPELKSPKEIKKEETKKIKEKVKEEKELAEKELRDTFNYKINQAQEAYQNALQNYDEASEKRKEWKSKKKDLKKAYKSVRKDYKKLKKSKKKALKNELGDIQDERDDKIDEIESQEIVKKSKLEKIKKEYSKKEEEAKKEISKKFDSKLKELESQVAKAKEKYDEAINKYKTWKSKRKEFKKKYKNLKKKIKKLEKRKEKEIEKKLEEISNEANEDLSKIDEKVLKIRKRAAEKREKLLKASEPEKEEENLEEESNEVDIEEEEESEDQTTIVEEDISKILRDLVLLYDSRNRVKFTILVENVSEQPIKNIRIGKNLADEFSNFQFQTNKFSDLEFKRGVLYSTIEELEPGEKAELVISTEITPIEKTIIGTGEIQISYLFSNTLISGIDVENFSAYSHVMHAIKKKEKETAPNIWDCYVIFKNNSDYKMELRSILVLDENKENKFVDFNEKELILPGEQFITDNWEVENETEPKFFRKVDYSITHRTEKRTRTTLKYDEDYFDLIDFKISKKFSQNKIKSFEESEIENQINIKNIGTIPIKGVIIEEIIPADFIPLMDSEVYSMRTSSGKLTSKQLEVNISPSNEDHNKRHKVQIFINLENDQKSANLIEVGEFLEIRYPFRAITPDYNKDYAFPIEVTTFYPIINKIENEEILKENFYQVNRDLNPNKLPKLDIIHKRRDLLIGKEIFPGRESDEFAISIMVQNDSNVEVSDIKITDSISESFEFVSSNIEQEIIKDKEKDTYIISFLIDKILPYQEKEIRYYVKKKEDAKINYEELESFIFG